MCEIVYNTSELVDHKGFYEIPGFSKYGISIQGEIVRKIDSKILSYHTAKPGKKNIRGGYKSIHLISDGDEIRFCSRHRLLCTVFKKKPGFKKAIVNHINGIGGDDRLENLEWCTYSQNTYHAYRNGLHSNKVNPVQVYEQRTNHEHSFDCGAEAMRFMDIDETTLYRRLKSHPGELYSDGFAVRYTNSNVEWNLSVCHIASKQRPIKAKNLLTNEVFIFKNVNSAAETLGLLSCSIHVALKRKKNGILRHYEFKNAYDKSPWTEVSPDELEMRMKRNDGKITMKVKLTHVVTGETIVYDSLKDCAKVIGISVCALSNRCKRNLTFDNYTYSLV